MIIFLLLLNTILPIIFVIWKCINRKGFLINHILLFSIGYWYYWVFPIVIGELFPKITLVSWYSLYRSIGEEKVIEYLLCVTLCYVAFIGAHFIPLKERKVTEYVASDKLNLIWMAALMAIFIIAVVNNAQYFFKGYTNRAENSFVGPLSAVFLMIFSLYVLYSLQQGKERFKDNFRNIYLAFYLMAAVIFVGYGGRMHVLTTVLALCVIYTSFYKRIKIGRVFGYGIAIVILVGAIGLWRLGNELSFSGIMDIIASESLYTAFPLLYFLSHYSISVIRFPLPLLSDFIYLIPSALLPNKADYLIGLSDVGYTLYSPFGALNSFMSFQVNFGLVGTIIVIILLVLLMRKLGQRNGSYLAKTVYACISAHLTFTFFRDPFEVSLMKNIFEFSFLIPALVAFVNSAVSNKGKIVIKRRG